MAMRTLFRLRSLINQLIKEGKIGRDTKINIEFARTLNNFNQRRAIEQVQRDNEAERIKFANLIKEQYKVETNQLIEPTEDDILKYKLWEEQNHKCLYTGNEIRISDFIGANSRYDIEHTVPLSRGGDDSQENKTLCECHFNRQIKQAKLPTELSNYAEIEARVEQIGWEDKIIEFHKEIEKTNNKLESYAHKIVFDKAKQNLKESLHLIQYF